MTPTPPGRVAIDWKSVGTIVGLLAAMVTAMFPEDRVNLLVIGAEGTFHPVKGVVYFDGNDRPSTPGYAEPMNAVRPKQPEPDVQPEAVPENPPSAEDDADPAKPEARRRRRG